MEACISLYEKTIGFYQQGKIILCVDQKTQIQALERLHPDIPSTFGHIGKREYHYKKHGVLNLIAGLEVATGNVIGGCYESNSNIEFCDFLLRAYCQLRNSNEINLIVDNYGTHTHMNVCRLVAKLCGAEISEKELKTKKQRVRFLESAGKKIIFHFLPTHASWLNQIEIWFSILSKKVIRRGNFSGKIDLATKITNYMDLEWNQNAHPFQRTYKGKVCCA